MPKRSPDTSSSDVGRSSESDVKPADQHDPSSEDENETPKKKPRKSPKSPKKDNLDGGDKICGVSRLLIFIKTADVSRNGLKRKTPSSLM